MQCKLVLPDSKVGLETNKNLHLCVLVGIASRNTVNPAQSEEPAVIDGQTRVLSNAEYVHDDWYTAYTEDEDGK